ncbi:PorP/SprF family type IX secretion system membrane protein [Poritiphilus flavus]|uniref:Type IX secretion system membrane protein PorP/SprF n=1 Tax=Poritiphilus flavus TaxID=2697053 RepID=A0A6L9EFB8_9FLAO|nr:PorP/SprF family type IX secretion system membrane protein [Poritiphilus flavus]NAS13406.1 type IX secretion system membrane protein PorP/SprF [Poritiphilus flavus]
MTKRQLALFALFIGLFVRSQEVELPPDFRQLNLVEFNSSLLNPVFSLDRNSPESVALWTRWQWQTVDGDPTTLFLNYTRQLNAVSSVGAGFLQHNTGVFLLTGGALNYARSFDLPSDMKIVLGLNVLGYQRELAADPFDPNIQVLPGLAESNDFILQAAPGVQFQYQRFRIGFVGENLLEYNFNNSRTESSSDEKVYVGLMSYNFPVTIFGSTDESFIQPTVYLKSLPGLDDQFGFTALFSTPKFWAQTGYNNFYGISAGAGGRFFKNWSIGALMEFGTSSDLEGQDPTFEFVTAYTFGPKAIERRLVENDEETEEELAAETEDEQEKQEQELAKAEALAQEAAQKRQDSINQVREAEALAETQRLQQQRTDSIARSERESALEAERLKQQQTLDSIENARRHEALAAAQREREERRQDSINAVRRQEALAAARKEREDRRRDSIAAVREQEAIVAARKKRQDRRRDSIAAVREQEAIASARKEREDRRRDSIAAVRQQEALAEARRVQEQKRQDSIQAAKLAEAEKEEVKPKAGEKYEEVANADGLQPGYYLIANVFGTKKYFERFMKTLSDQGLEPKSFYRSLNKYNYVYLRRYNTIGEARRARDSKFGGRYPDKTWIFRVVGD